jgi:type VI secretion system lysozyme-like protein
MFLFQLLAVAGEWDKAKKQLQALAQLSGEAQMLAMAYGQAIDAELERAEVFAGRQRVRQHAASDWCEGVVDALHHLTNGRAAEAIAARDAAFDAAPDTPGAFNDEAFAWIADADARFGPAFEAIIGGRYGLQPFDQVAGITSEGPRTCAIWSGIRCRSLSNPASRWPASCPRAIPAVKPPRNRRAVGARHQLAGERSRRSRIGAAPLDALGWRGSRAAVLAHFALRLTMAVSHRLTPTLFDKLVADIDISGLKDIHSDAPEVSREKFRHYTVPRLDRFNEAALRGTIRRELAWLLNTTNLEALHDLEPYPHVQTSVLNYGLSDLAGKPLTRRAILNRAREIRKAIRQYEPRLGEDTLSVEPAESHDRPNTVTFIIRADITAAAQAMPVKFRTEVDPETVSVDVRE